MSEALIVLWKTFELLSGRKPSTYDTIQMNHYTDEPLAVTCIESSTRQSQPMANIQYNA